MYRRHLLACTLLVTGLPALARAVDTPWPTQRWTSATPASQGLHTGVLAELVEHLATPGFNTDSVILVRNGRLVLEAYAAPFRAELRHDLRSVTKTVIGTLVGAAIQQGRMASDQARVLDFFPERAPTSAGQQAMTVRHLLEMQGGIDWREWPYDAQSDALKMWSSPDYTDYVLARPVGEPGERMLYGGAGPHLLSAVLTRSTGGNAADYARRHVFKTLGIGDFAWASDPQGHSVGDSTLHMRALDLARIGLLHLRRGQWEGRQLLPPGWTEALFTDPGPPHGISSPALPPTYRTLWWTDGRVPYATASGRHGQFVILLPRQDMVLVVSAKTDDESRGSRPPELVEKYLLKAVQRGASAGGQARLARALQRLARRQGPASRTPSESALAQSRRLFALEPNAAGYREFALLLGGPEPHYRMQHGAASDAAPTGVRGGPLGLDGRYLESTRAGDRLWARRGRWVDDRSFRIETQHLESAFVSVWTAHFLGDGELELVYTNGETEELRLRGRARE